jgi:hypothetical protein
MRHEWIIIFALLCLGTGLFIIIASIKRWNVLYKKEKGEWRIMSLPFYSLFKVFKDLDDTYFMVYHVLIGIGFLLGFLYIVYRLITLQRNLL